MNSKYIRAALPLTGIAASLSILAGSALATGPADHTGDPGVWGPPLEALCDSPTDAAAAGYNVIDDPTTGVADGGLLEGTNGADAIFANGGNDDVYAGAGNDLICGSFGNDELFGEGGNLDGGTEIDRCDGGNGDDVASALCNTVAG